MRSENLPPPRAHAGAHGSAVLVAIRTTSLVIPEFRVAKYPGPRSAKTGQVNWVPALRPSGLAGMTSIVTGEAETYPPPHTPSL